MDALEKRVKLFPTRGGVKIPLEKSTLDCETVTMPAPQKVLLPMQQHVGAPCAPTVKKGDKVQLGQVIGDSEKPVSAPIHASVSGTVTGLRDIMTSAGAFVTAVEIESDGLMEPHPDIKPPAVSSHKEFVAAIRASGLVGLGGAGFPTHIKLSPPPGVKIDTLIINAAECEPYITSDYRECVENTDDIIAGIRAVTRWLEIPRAIIAIENDKPKAIEILSAAAKSEYAAGGADISVAVLRAGYPKGAEKVLVYAVCGRKIKTGGLPSDVNTLVMNVSSVAFLARYLKTGMPLVSRRITVDGPAVANPANVLVQVGTPIDEVIAFTGGYSGQPGKIIMGGPMMGIAIYDRNAPILKQNNAIIAFTEEKARLREPSACIRCGRCIMVCPVSIMPVEISRAYERWQFEIAEKLNAHACIECGCCSYCCPANRPLVQNIRLAKAEVAKRKAGKVGANRV